MEKEKEMTMMERIAAALAQLSDDEIEPTTTLLLGVVDGLRLATTLRERKNV